ncbi:hypothetical protein U1Q18_023053 [Sarracenia purpurea var. burkii]
MKIKGLRLKTRPALLASRTDKAIPKRVILILSSKENGNEERRGLCDVLSKNECVKMKNSKFLEYQSGWPAPVEEHPVGINFGLSYKISIACSILLLGTHITILLTMQNRSGAQWESPDPDLLVLLSETMQVLTLAITLLPLYKIPHKKHTKFPWILRTWWVCSFLLSLGSTTLDAHFMIENHDHLKLENFADGIGFLASTCLLGISIRGKTDITFDMEVVPLLNIKAEKHSERKMTCLYGKATLFQLISFSWLNPLFTVGIRKPLHEDEVPDLDTRDSARFITHTFDEILKHVKERDQTANPSIYKTIFVFVKKKAAINAFFAVISAGASYVGPYLIYDFVNFLNKNKIQSLGSGYLIVIGFLGAKLVETAAERQCIFGANQLRIQLRAALISQIYKKGPPVIKSIPPKPHQWRDHQLHERGHPKSRRSHVVHEHHLAVAYTNFLGYFYFTYKSWTRLIGGISCNFDGDGLQHTNDENTEKISV